MPIRVVVTRGYGNGTFSGTVAFVVRRGYGIAAAVAGMFGILMRRRKRRQ